MAHRGEGKTALTFSTAPLSIGKSNSGSKTTLDMKPDLVWSAALGELQLQMTQATFDTWLRGARFLKFEDGAFVVGVKNGYAKDWLEHRLLPTIKRTLRPDIPVVEMDHNINDPEFADKCADLLLDMLE